jgi:hypothetical protein
MYLECRICKRVTQHKEVDDQSKTFVFGAGVVKTSTFYICPHCNTGISGDHVTVNISGRIESNFTKRFG